ncbi:MAG: TolC family protein, partial [Planctomycetota bacterium]
PENAPWRLSLDEAIRIALLNARVVRVAAGTQAVSSGSTIYDPAISNTRIDQPRADFDPTVQSRNTFFRSEQPFGAIVDPGPPAEVDIFADPQTGFRNSTGIAKQFITGGTVGLDVTADQNRRGVSGLPLNPQASSDVALSLNQPLLQGAGSAANLAPIVIARLNTERSYFQMKSSVQDMVLSVVQTYWNLSLAHIELFARRQQEQQGRETLERSEARLEAGFGTEGEVAQARVTYEGFRASVLGAEANILNQEALLRNLLGLPPAEQRPIELASAPRTTQLVPEWTQVLRLAEQYRPDIIELKLILEADQQQLLLSRNQAMPRVDLGALYRWNGLQGVTPSRQVISSRGGQFTDWEMGVNFSVPLGLRRERAQLREVELLICRDRANLEQSIHATAHVLAGSFRNLAQFYAQYVAFRRVREAAQINVEQQLADYRSDRATLFLDVLQALTSWGNAVVSEYQSLVLYNTELARLENLTGTILESHGIRFIEERYHSLGPLGCFGPEPCYPRDVRPGPNADRPDPPGSEGYQRPQPIEVPLEPEELPPPPATPFPGDITPVPPVDQMPGIQSPPDEPNAVRAAPGTSIRVVRLPRP